LQSRHCRTAIAGHTGTSTDPAATERSRAGAAGLFAVAGVRATPRAACQRARSVGVYGVSASLSLSLSLSLSRSLSLSKPWERRVYGVSACAAPRRRATPCGTYAADAVRASAALRCQRSKCGHPQLGRRTYTHVCMGARTHVCVRAHTSPPCTLCQSLRVIIFT
jgi:hypothetical protein